MPTNVIFVNEKSIIPVNHKYLREDSKNIFFKYNNQKLNILGKITKKIELTNSNNDIFSILNYSMNDFFKMFSIDIENKFVLSPIGIYC